MKERSGDLLVEVAAPGSDDARGVLRAYTDEVASRFYGRPATAAEVDAALEAHPSDDLAPPRGLFLLARSPTAVLGCAGLHLLPAAVGEVKRVYVTPAARGRGLGRRLMGEVEHHARQHAVTLLRLDTRADLVEARGLYAALGYQEVPAFDGGPYAEHWYAKSLT